MSKSSSRSDNINSRSDNTNSRNDNINSRSENDDLDSESTTEESSDFIKKAAEGAQKHQPYKKYDKESEMFRMDRDLLWRLMQAKNIDYLKSWIKMEFGKICGYNYLKSALVKLIMKEDPDMNVSETDNPSTLIVAIEKIIFQLKQKFKLFDVELKRPDILEGSKLEAELERESKKTLSKFDAYVNKMLRLEAELKETVFMVQSLQAELSAAEDYIAVLKQEKIADKSLTEEASFMEDMHYRLNKSENKQSSLLEERERDKNMFNRLKSKLDEVHKEHMIELQERDKKIAAIYKDLQLEGGIRKEVLSKILSIEPDKEACKKALNDWMKAIHETIGDKQTDINKMKELAKTLDDEIAQLHVNMEMRQMEMKEMAEQTEQIDLQVERQSVLIEIKSEELEGLTKEVEGLQEQIQELELEFISLANTRDQKSEEIQSLMDRSPAGTPGSPDNMGSSPSSYIQGSPGMQMSPEHYQSDLSRSSPMSLSSPQSDSIGTSPPTPLHGSPFISSPSPTFPLGVPGTQPLTQPQSSIFPQMQPISPGAHTLPQPQSGVFPQTQPISPGIQTPPQLQTGGFPQTQPISPGMQTPPQPQSGIFPHTQPIAPGTQTLPQPQSAMFPQMYPTAPGTQTLPQPQSAIFPQMHPTAPGTHNVLQPQSVMAPNIQTINPAIQNLSEIRNRFAIGQDFNMQTVHTGSPIPYAQTTRLESGKPSEISPLINSQITHTAELPSSQFITPPIPPSRYGYTDPKAKVLNLPPDDDVGTGNIRRTLVLKSPTREKPLLVNIDVKPQPLTQTAEGDKFICDVSLNLAEGKSTPEARPVYTYGVPPSITPSTTRRHGLFTPKSIFKKHHFNFRKLFGPNYVSPEMPWSPHNLPYTSPISGLLPSPHFSDRSISWEQNAGYYGPLDEEDKTFKASPSAMNKTYDREMNRTFDKSPHDALNRTFDKKPSVGTRSRSISPGLSRTFDRGSSSKYGKSFDKDMSPRQATFDDSPSPVIKSRFRRGASSSYDESPSPVIKSRFARGAPSPYDEIPSPVIKSRFARGAPSPYDESPSPVIQSRFARGAPSPYDESPSPLIQSRFGRGAPSPYDESPSPVIQSRFGRGAPSPYDESPSPVIKSRFGRGVSSSYDSSSESRGSSKYGDEFGASPTSFERRYSPGMNETFDRNFSPQLNGSRGSSRLDSTADRSFSPRLDRFFGQNTSPQLNGTFNSRSASRRGTPDRNISYGLDENFEIGVSPQSDLSFSGNGFPQLDATFDRNYSPRSRVGLDESFKVGGFQSSGEAALDGTFDMDSSQNVNGPSDKSFSPGISGRLGGRFLDATFEKHSSGGSEASNNNDSSQSSNRSKHKMSYHSDDSSEESILSQAAKVIDRNLPKKSDSASDDKNSISPSEK